MYISISIGLIGIYKKELIARCSLGCSLPCSESGIFGRDKSVRRNSGASTKYKNDDDDGDGDADDDDDDMEKRWPYCQLHTQFYKDCA